ncbi:hypothetical protein MXB_3954, partial [Myxobolus squamalis]
MQKGEAVDQPSDIGSQVPSTVGEIDSSIASRPRNTISLYQGGFGFTVIKVFRGKQPTSDVPSSASPIQKTDEYLTYFRNLGKFGLSQEDSDETDHEKKGQLDHPYTYLFPHRYMLHDGQDDEYHYDRDEDDRSTKSSTCEECTKDYK